MEVVSSIRSYSGARQEFGEFRADSFIQCLGIAYHWRECVFSRPGPAGVDDDARIAAIILAIDHRVEHRAPAAAQDFQILPRIEARAHGPYHLVDIGGIDVVIDDHDEAIGIGAGMALRSNQSRLLGMTAIELLDRDGEPKPAAAGLM